MQIKFWGPDNPHGLFSNFAQTPIVIEGVRYPTAEHFFQSQKTSNSYQWREIVEAPTPLLAKQLGKKCELRPDWEINKVAVMYQVVREKALQCPQFRQELLDTGDAELEENSPFDPYWGIGRDGSGRNMLGEILMDVRQEIKDGEL